MNQSDESRSGRQEPAVADASPLGHARARRIPGAIVLDPTGGVLLVNVRATEMLREVADDDRSAAGDAHLPRVLASLVPQLRARLRDRSDTSAAALLTVDLCVRACNMTGAGSGHMLLVLERVERRDAVSRNLERFALSPRETEVVMLVLYGHSNRRIAGQLFLTEYTLKDHLKRIFAKLGVRTRTALAAKVLGWGEQE